MPTSSENRTPKAPRLEGEHWNEFIATLCLESTVAFGDWLSDDLANLETKLDQFASPMSVRKSLRRS
ncbi:MAG: hypothetical protein HKN47_01370 [Pirellulaceae bacterium]|nr:hypothetical protein [Pirellulaceae bacterium]